MRVLNSRPALLALGVSMPLLAQAHPGHPLGAGFVNGVLHPLSGVDHLLAMLAAGAWAAQLGDRMRWAMPLSVVTLMMAGAALGFSGMAVGVVEQGIAASVLVLGMLVATAARLPSKFSLLLAGGFALFHGYAHAVESTSGAVSGYIAGFVLSNLGLQFLGLAAAQRLGKSRYQYLLRWGGGLIATCGATLLVVA